MSSVIVSFFAASSFNCRDPISLSRLNGCPSHLCSGHSCLNLVATCLNCSAHFRVATSIGVFSSYFVGTSTCLVETLLVHLATTPRRDISYLLRLELFSFGVATRSFF